MNRYCRIGSAALRQLLMLTDSAAVLEKMETLGVWTQLIDSELYIDAIADIARYVRLSCCLLCVKFCNIGVSSYMNMCTSISLVRPSCMLVSVCSIHKIFSIREI